MRFLVARMVDRRLGKTRVVDATEAVRLRSEGWIVLMDPGEFQEAEIERERLASITFWERMRLNVGWL